MLKILIMVALITINSCKSVHHPIVLFHGASGTVLDVSLDFSDWCTIFIPYKSVTLWINPYWLSPIVTECFDKYAPLVKSGHRFVTPKGVHVRPRKWGYLESIEMLEPIHKLSYFIYMKNLIDILVERGYVRDKTIRAAQYDFRISTGKLIVRAINWQLLINLFRLIKGQRMGQKNKKLN